MKVELIEWADSQACIGCKNGCLVDNEKVGSSAYICLENHYPDGGGEHFCNYYKEEKRE